MRLQNYTAVEKDEVVLSCELSKAGGEVKWFKDGNEIVAFRNILFQSDGRKRMLVIKRAAKKDMGVYTCDCGTDKTTADLNIEGNPSPRICQDYRIMPRPPPKPRLHLDCCSFFSILHLYVFYCLCVVRLVSFTQCFCKLF